MRIRSRPACVERCTANSSAAKASCLLRQLAPASADRIAPVLARCPRIALAAGERCPREDLDEKLLLVVEEGIAAIVTSRPGSSRQMVVAIARPGDILSPPRLDEQLAGLTDLVVTAVPGSAGAAIVSSSALAMLLLERLLEAVSERQESLARFAAVDHGERVRDTLLQLARAHGRVTKEGVHLDLPLTHQLLAQMTGSARETVTSALVALTQEGFLAREGRRYRLTIQPHALAS